MRRGHQVRTRYGLVLGEEYPSMTSAAIYIEKVIRDAGGTVGAWSVGAGIIVGETLLLVGMCRSYYHISDIY